MSSVSALNSLLSSSSTSSASSAINLGSLLAAATGASSTAIDVTSAVAAGIYAAQAPERQWQAQQATLKSQITAITTIQTALSSLSTDLSNLNNLQGSLTSVTATSSLSSVLSASAATGAVSGTHSIAVTSLASSASWYSPALTGSSASLGTTSLVITSGSGTQTSFALGSGTNSLDQLASAINAGNIGVNASVVSDASGARLALVGSTSGSAADFSVSLGSTTGASWSSASLASANAPLSAGSFNVGDGTSSTSISVSAGDTLTQLAGRINSQGLNLTASIVTNSSGSHLQITGSGGNAVSVSSDPTFNFTRASTGANASLTVDGVPVTSASNTITGAIRGVTLNLVGTTLSSSPATLTIAPDATQITAAVSQFVTDYNSALSLVNTQFSFSATSGAQGVLSSDPTLRSLQTVLMGITSYTATGSTSGSSTSLSSLGITVGNDGALILNSNKLAQVAGSSASTIQNFFQGVSLNGFANSVQTQLTQFHSPSSGSLALDMKGLNQAYTDLQSHVDEYESGYIASQRTVLTAMYSKAEIALQQLPATLKQLQAQLGNNSSGG